MVPVFVLELEWVYRRIPSVSGLYKLYTTRISPPPPRKYGAALFLSKNSLSGDNPLFSHGGVQATWLKSSHTTFFCGWVTIELLLLVGRRVKASSLHLVDECSVDHQWWMTTSQYHAIARNTNLFLMGLRFLELKCIEFVYNYVYYVITKRQKWTLQKLEYFFLYKYLNNMKWFTYVY